MRQRITRISLCLVALSAGVLLAAERPGYLGRGETLLPNGWRIAPAGKHVMVGDLPLGMLVSPDGRWAIVTNNGYAKPTLTIVDLATLSVAGATPIPDAWLGLVWHPDGKRLFASGGADGKIRELLWSPGKLVPRETFDVGKAVEEGFLGGVALRPDGRRLFVVDVLGQRLSALDLASGEVAGRRDLAAEPYTCLLSADGATLYVSLWGGSKLLLVDPETLEPRGEIPVGEHPNAMAQSADGRRLFVACAHTNSVWAVDLAAKTATEQIAIALSPGAPPGSTPNALALSPDGRTLLVANADNNAVAVVDVSKPSASRVSGFIPTGWYPTGVAFTPDGRRILILSGKGLTSMPNPRGPQPGAEGDSSQYIGAMLTGSLSILETPGAAQLAKYTDTVRRVTPGGGPRARSKSARASGQSPVPQTAKGRSPIRHVFYVIRENRTYDQIFGDMPQGNGDASLCLFGEDATPNAHALAREFVLLDNFYVNAEVSYDGHAFSTAAYASDFVEKVWPMNYGGRGGKYLSEGGGPQRNAYGNVTAPSQGYLWDSCRRAGITYRSYGEFGHREDEEEDGEDSGKGPVVPSVPGLEGHMSPTFPSWNLEIPDGTRVDAWLQEFREFEASGDLPRLSIFHLPNDHTAGTRAGSRTPRAMIAENDVALGRMVEAISKSRYWKDSVIFVLEDDAQDGPDHVDAHRSVALVVSPYTRRGALDSTLYTTASMLRTIELILGLPPMSQYDAAATPMQAAFTAQPDPTPYTARPARVSLDERNDPAAYGSDASAAMNFSEPDRAPDLELNEIVWRSVRGAGSPMPPPVRSAFAPAAQDADDD